jgi:hypothetical protein
MKYILKKFPDFLNEYSLPGSVGVPASVYAKGVNSVNYKSTNITMPEVIDPMYEDFDFGPFMENLKMDTELISKIENSDSAIQIIDMIADKLKSL